MEQGSRLTGTTFTIFYSWQSDLPDSTNRGAIRAALRTAKLRVERDIPSATIVLDEATRDEPGSPNIPATILEKIRGCDAFVADITTINASVPEGQRKTPNPNVLFELGYAAAHLGWGRIIMVFNTAMGRFPADVPFDIDRHRTSQYRLPPEGPDVQRGRDQLESVLTTAIRTIVSRPPLKPQSVLQLSPEELRRQRDVKYLSRILSTIDMESLQLLALSLPTSIDTSLLYFVDVFDAMLQNPVLHIYDDETRNALLAMQQALHQCLSHDIFYKPSANPLVQIFGGPNVEQNPDSQALWDEIAGQAGELQQSMDALLRIVRERFVEIDIYETSKTAWEAFAQINRAL